MICLAVNNGISLLVMWFANYFHSSQRGESHHLWLKIVIHDRSTFITPHHAIFADFTNDWIRCSHTQIKIFVLSRFYRMYYYTYCKHCEPDLAKLVFAEVTWYWHTVVYIRQNKIWLVVHPLMFQKKNKHKVPFWYCYNRQLEPFDHQRLVKPALGLGRRLINTIT